MVQNLQIRHTESKPFPVAIFILPEYVTGLDIRHPAFTLEQVAGTPDSYSSISRGKGERIQIIHSLH